MGEEIEVDLSNELWNEDDTERFSNESYLTLLIEQYKIYVEMADRVNLRRTVTNVFFLTVHAVIISMLGLSLSHSPNVLQPTLLLFPLLALLVMCYAWWRIVQYFRRSSRAKSVVIGQLEKRLPSSPSWSAESKALGKNPNYNPLKRMEITLPIVFAVLYIFSFVYVAFVL